MDGGVKQYKYTGYNKMIRMGKQAGEERGKMKPLCQTSSLLGSTLSTKWKNA
jgi:hypothetical protein